MSRSAADATRFTATSPHAYAKHTPLRSSASNASSSPQSHFLPRKMQPPTPTSPNGSTETPAQKVARLRRAHDAQKLSQVTRWEKIQVTGRRWADRAHRFTILSLIGLTGVAGVVTVFSLGDMIIYNRRKRNAFIAEQFVTMKQTLLEAQRAEMMGTANEDQVQLLNQERAAFEEAEAKKLQGGIWKTITGVFSTEGLKVAENPSDLALVGEGGLRKMGEESLPMNTVSDPALDSHIMKSGILQALDEQRREGERAEQASGVEGGQLDRFAEQPTASTKAKGGWTSWITSK